MSAKELAQANMVLDSTHQMMRAAGKVLSHFADCDDPERLRSLVAEVGESLTHWGDQWEAHRFTSVTQGL